MERLMGKTLILLALLLPPVVSGAGDAGFSLDLDGFSFAPRLDPRTEARLAEWNSPMGRLMAAFEQQQAWVMRGAQPGLERVTGVAFRLKMQNGVPVKLLAATMEANFDISTQPVTVQWPWKPSEGEPPHLSLDEEIAILLGQRLKPR
jgi:hypothetical protein